MVVDLVDGGEVGGGGVAEGERHGDSRNSSGGDECQNIVKARDS
jgi:hypothetical protein